MCISVSSVTLTCSLTKVYKIDGDQIPDQPPQPSPAESNFGDSSGPFFSIYSKVAEKEDNRMVEQWQKDADGILIFVSTCVGIHAVLCITWNTMIDWSILCCGRCTP